MNSPGTVYVVILSGFGSLLFGQVPTSSRSDGHPVSKQMRSSNLFLQMMPVLTSPRCMNCHTATDFPRQDDDRHRHLMLVMRGPDDHGAPALRCQACHRNVNSNDSRVPGAPDWRLAPLGMAWEGLSASALCRTMLDPAKGKQTAQTIVEHMETPLVQWAWSPGLDLDGKERKPPPMTSDKFLSLVRAWANSGARCP
jgi:hypothetical protein